MTTELEQYIRRMPKVELHVHLQGATQPQTLLELARRNNMRLPFDTVEGLRSWYAFTDFGHFIDIYLQACACMRTADDIEFITREFLRVQAVQNIVWSEVTYTAWLHRQVPWADQLTAIRRARAWAVAEFNIDMGLIVDIPRNIAPEEGLTVAEWVCQDHGDLVLALGLGGPEIGHPPEKFADAFALARSAGVPCILHAGETMGPESIWSAIRVADTCRIGHGVRCVEDPTLVAYLREHQIPLEVCPTSNVCLKIYSSLAQHTLPQLLRAGLYVTINSDDPPMFNTSLTDEYIVCAREYGWDKDTIKHFVQNAARASLLNGDAKASLLQRLA